MSLTTKRESDGACYAVSANLIVPINYIIIVIFYILKNSTVAKAANCLCTRSSLSKSVIVTELQATEACSNFDLAKA
jgi:hypothetical protein